MLKKTRNRWTSAQGGVTCNGFSSHKHLPHRLTGQQSLCVCVHMYVGHAPSVTDGVPPSNWITKAAFRPHLVALSSPSHSFSAEFLNTSSHQQQTRGELKPSKPQRKWTFTHQSLCPLLWLDYTFSVRFKTSQLETTIVIISNIFITGMFEHQMAWS